MRAFTIIEAMIVLAIFVILAAIIGGTIAEMKRNAQPATIIERTHAPASTGTAVRDGKVVTVFNPEQYTLVVQNDEGAVYSMKVSPEAWAAAKPGERINDPKVER